ncbi:hypothetical protein ACQ4M3_32685 [Leptolyngbya sp. AN03gr2]|uniref:hypothetical protein n=1 Tax=Leptolyngbya sp. AN03gr2 TaxID=3423364 RepID=UPI003D321F6F
MVCLGDGHDGIWNLHEAVVPMPEQRIESLDWYHLKENLYKLSSAEVDREQIEADLWRGDVVACTQSTRTTLCSKYRTKDLELVGIAGFDCVSSEESAEGSQT